MKSYTSASFISESPCVTALGCFDGVHIGHTRLICEAKKIALQKSLTCAVWSFNSPPKSYFSKSSTPLLTTESEKRICMSRLGVDIFVSVTFNEDIANISARDFFYDILIDKMNTKSIVCGYNYRFGKNGEGDISLLDKLCKESHIELVTVPEVTLHGKTVSSSEIRTALKEGRLEEAQEMLGRPYSLRAKVCDGQHLGRKLGFPTINQVFNPNKLLGKNGVYVSRVFLGHQKKYGITNIGTRPTVNGNLLCAETHIFDFEGDLYKKAVTVELLSYLREERKFSSLDELCEQVQKDIATAKKFINK